MKNPVNLHLFRDLPIRHKLTLLLVALVSVALALTSAAGIVNDVRTTRTLMANQFSTLANVLAANSAVALSVDPESAQTVLSDLRAEPTIVYACAFDAQGRIVARYEVPGYESFTPPPPAGDGHAFTPDGYLDVFKRATVTEEFVGTIYLRATTEELRTHVRRAITSALTVLAAALAIAVLLSFPLQRVISGPILKLVEATRTVSKNSDFSVRVPKLAEDELGVLCDAFNSMLAQIQQRDLEIEEHRLHLETLVQERTRSLESKTAALQESEERLNLALRSSGVGTWSWSMATNMIAWDEYAHPLFGLATGKFSGTFEDLLNMVHQEDRERVRRDVRSSLESLGEFDTEFQVIWADGSAHDLTLRGKVYCDETGQPMRTVGVCWDITQRKQTEKAVKSQAELLARLNGELKRSNVELEQFAYIASHDLQEPLRKVQAFGTMLTDEYSDKLGDEARDYIRRMLGATDRMKTLINDLLTYSRITTKGQPFASVDLSVTAREVVSDLETVVQETGGRLEIGPLPTLDADATQMRQLLQNMIANGLKYHKDDVPPVVKVEGRLLDNRRHAVLPASDSPSACEITVTDNGIGFEQVYADRIFAPFVRLHGRSSKYEGTGIGLAVCRKIVERHGGIIVALSSPGEGATFRITLPVQQAATS